MRTILFLTAAVALASAATWKAYAPGEDYKFANMSQEEWIRNYLMPLDPIELLHEPRLQGEPEKDHTWDLRADDKMGSCIHPIRDQGSCGSCWAFATSNVAADRACIDSKGKGDVDLIFSPQFLVDCDTQESGCNGAATQRVIGWIA